MKLWESSSTYSTVSCLFCLNFSNIQLQCNNYSTLLYVYVDPWRPFQSLMMSEGHTRWSCCHVVKQLKSWFSCFLSKCHWSVLKYLNSITDKKKKKKNNIKKSNLGWLQNFWNEDYVKIRLPIWLPRNKTSCCLLILDRAMIHMSHTHISEQRKDVRLGLRDGNHCRVAAYMGESICLL